MAAEYKLSHTAKQIDEKLTQIDTMAAKLENIDDLLTLDSKETRQTISYFGQNPIASADEDTPEKWVALGTGHAYIYGTGILQDQPVGYGLLENVVTGLTSFQTFTSWTDGSVRRKWTRTGQTTWSAWLMTLDENSIIPVENGGTGVTTLEDTQYTTPRYRASSLHVQEVVPDVNGVITWIYE